MAGARSGAGGAEGGRRPPGPAGDPPAPGPAGADNVIPWPGSRAGRRSGAPHGSDSPRVEIPGGVDGLLAGLPDTVQPVAEHLAVRALEFDAGQTPGVGRWATRLDIETMQAAAAAVRTAILRADAAGAPPDAIARAHERLDAAAFDLARTLLGVRDRAQRRLLEEASHDLRSPLNSVLFLADALANEHSGALNPVQRRQVGVLYTAAVTLVKLVNDLIDFARLGDAEIRVSRTSFSVESVIADVRRLVGPLFDHRRIELVDRVKTEGLRTGDPQLLSRVLLNLVSNAAAAVAEAGRVSVLIGETADGLLRIEVLDDGAGTDVERLRKLIAPPDPGTRAGETRGWTRGLGLSISARLVRAANGRMQVESLHGEGTCFTIELPFERL